MAGRRQTLPIRNHTRAAQFQRETGGDHCTVSRSHGIVKPTELQAKRLLFLHHLTGRDLPLSCLITADLRARPNADLSSGLRVF